LLSPERKREILKGKRRAFADVIGKQWGNVEKTKELLHLEGREKKKKGSVSPEGGTKRLRKGNTGATASLFR